MNIDVKVYDDSFYNLIDVESGLDQIASGFTFIEGPIWSEKYEHLTFNDIPESKTYRIENNKVNLIYYDKSKCNGNAYDLDGNILTCEHANSRITKMNINAKEKEVVVSHYEGKELNSPNDIVLKSNGDIYFTDPRFGRNPSRVGVERNQELSFQGVFKLDKSYKELELIDKELSNPNGICFSKDEKYLFVNDSPNKAIYRYEINPKGKISKKELWAITYDEGIGLPDGMKIDIDDNLYCCAQGGVHIFNSDGKCLGIVKIPEQAGNLCFGDRDMKSIYVTASTTVYKMRAKVEGIKTNI
ncbi:MAG: SMP-30/gluconolactonase/LRE family protein [Peptostreptococcaceae bacterium]